MGRVRASIVVPGLASEAEELWYDTTRWPSFIDGLHHLARLEGDWPRAGARVLWDSQPGGRARAGARDELRRARRTIGRDRGRKAARYTERELHAARGRGHRGPGAA